METVVLVDLDGVLVKSNTPCLLSTYKELLKLSIPEEQLADLSENEFHLLPQVQTYREKVGEDRYRQQCAWLEWYPPYIVKCSMIQDALAGVRYLEERADELGYCTARYISFHEEWNADVVRMTHLWLQQHHFPSVDQVLFCNGFQAKLEVIAEHLVEHPEMSVMLIDDSAKELCTAFDALPEEQQRLLAERLTLIAFGYEHEQEIQHTLRVIPLEDWGSVQRLEKEFRAYATVRRRQEQPQQ